MTDKIEEIDISFPQSFNIDTEKTTLGAYVSFNNDKVIYNDNGTMYLFSSLDALAEEVDDNIITSIIIDNGID